MNLEQKVKTALAICYKQGLTGGCDGCVYREYEGGFCIDALMQDALVLIEQLTERKDNEC